METLPIDTINANQIRAKLARALFDNCPPQLGDAVAITGAVARGVADKYSGVEITVWVDELQPPDVYLQWLDAAGAHIDLDADPQIIDKRWLTTRSVYRGILFEITWETWESLAVDLTIALAGDATDHTALARIWQVADAAPLRAHPDLDRWQQALQHYPEDLQEALINPILHQWAQPHWYPSSIVNLWPLAQQKAHIALTARLLREVENVLRMVFAINQRWEPDWKWLGLEIANKTLPLKPAQLVERVNTILTTPDADDSVRQCLQLIIDTLELLPPDFEREPAQTRVHEAFHPDAQV